MKKLLLVLFLLPTIVFGRKFYFSSSTGNDSYNSTQAQNQATPWQTLQKLQRCVTSGNVVFLPGDTIAFKRGDVFANGFVNGFSTMQWAYIAGDLFFTAPSGTPSQPIVITNYGDVNLPLPNWLYPSATYPVSTWRSREGRGIVYFAGVHDIIIDGIQSNDYRVPESDKANPGYSGGWILGEWTQGTSGGLKNSYGDTSRRKYMVTRFTVKNCKFNNTMYGIQGMATIDSKITNNTFTNFKSSADTAGTHDIMAGAIDGIAAIRTEISYNYFKGAWGKSGRIGSCQGLGGVALDIFNLYNSKVCYNTIIDCGGAYEIGNLDRNDSNSGTQYDTFAFNKIINCGQFAYIHGSVGDPFQGNNHHLSHWNNVIISNNNDRLNGLGFGKDVYGDGQGFRPGTTQPWWFCRDITNTFNPPGYPLRPTVSTTAGSNIITVSNATGISVGSVWFTDDDDLASIVYKTVTVTAINGLSITLSDPSTRSESNYTNGAFYLPVSNTTWSNPSNPAYQNYGGTRFTMQYSGDATLWGSNIDTMIDNRNNIFYWTTGIQGLYDRNRFKRSANIYYYLGGARYASALGGTINYRGTKERIMSSGLLFKDTLNSIYPENWDLHLNDTSYARNNGVAISGFNKDFDGNSIVGITPFIGLYKPSTSITSLTATVTTGTIICFNGTTNVTVGATGGVPPYNGTGTFVQAAGSKSYNISDAVGSTANVSVTLSQPTDVTGSVSFTPITVQGGTTTVTITATGGTGAKTYSLDGGSYQSGTSFTSVTAGNHTISAKDASGCTHNFNFNVTYNPSIIKSRLKFKN
jgi:hypothetical protein